MPLLSFSAPMKPMTLIPSLISRGMQVHLNNEFCFTYILLLIESLLTWNILPSYIWPRALKLIMPTCFMGWLEHLIWMRTRWWWNLPLSSNSCTMPQPRKASISLKARCKWTMNTSSHLADLFPKPRIARWFQSKYTNSSFTRVYIHANTSCLQEIASTAWWFIGAGIDTQGRSHASIQDHVCSKHQVEQILLWGT